MKLATGLSVAAWSACCVCVCLGLTSSSSAQTIGLTFDSLPTAQGWRYQGNVPETGAFSVDGSKLTLSTISGPSNATSIYFRSNIINPSVPFIISMRARILQVEADGSFGFSSFTGTEIFQAYLRLNAIRVQGQDFPLDTTRFHDYRFEAVPGVGSRIFVDGTLLSSFAPSPTSVAQNSVLFGDGSGFSRANVAAELEMFIFSQDADNDGDGLPNDWETRFGLNPSSAAGDDGAAGDPDADGSTNVEEYQAGTHPKGYFKRFLAEGAVNAFFDVRLALLNVGSDSARVLMRFLQPGGATLPLFELLPTGRRRTLTRADLGGLVSPDFSTVVESDQPIVVDRTMSWDATGYGSHAETSVASPSTTWYLAEGSTSGDFSLFYLLQNPNPTATTATIRYLRPSGLPPIERTQMLPANSRTTIPVDGQDPELASTDVSAVVTAPMPIIVERAMYMTRPSQVFAAGHGSAGVTAPATSWFLAEGATGPFFDLFVLLANPGNVPAQVSVDYLLSDGRTYTKAYQVPANGRSTIWVDDEQIPAGSGLRPLANVAVSSTVTSTNGVPIIVERTMWWPSPALTTAFWTEAHNSPGATATAARWAVAEGEVGGAQGAETYLLIANTSAFGGQARVRLYFEDGTTADRTFALMPRSRTNVGVSTEFPAAVGRRFGALVESLGATPAQIVVERAMYTSPGGILWAAGTNALATPVP